MSYSGTTATVTGVAIGNCTITVTVKNGTNTANANVTVTVQEKAKTFDITFSSTGSSNIQTTTAISTYISSGAQYISSVDTLTKIYGGDGKGIKLGTKNNAGNITFTTSSTFQEKFISSITLTCQKY